MNRPTTVPLGFELGTGAPIGVPIQHLAVTGQTQLSGKTTTLEALIARSGLKAIAFVTKRAEGSFGDAHQVQPYFRERADWQFVSAVLEASLRERLKFERSWIMRACKGAETLADVHANVKEAMVTAKGMSADVYLTLDHYLQIVTPQIENLEYSATLKLALGVNVMDLSAYTTELQSLVIRSVIEWVYEHGKGIIVVIPEAWEFIPQNRGSPVLLACETLIRKGGASKNFVWLDSQDIAGVHKNILRQVGTWIIGVQREANEVKRALSHITGGVRKPKVDDVMELERGQFFVCFGKTVAKAYVQPAWMLADEARAIAMGLTELEDAVSEPTQRKPTKEAHVRETEAVALREENKRLTIRNQELEQRIESLKADARQPASSSAPVNPAAFDFEQLYARIKERAAADPGVLKLLREKPAIEVQILRPTIEASDSTLFGRLAALLSEGWFDQPKNGNATFVELQRRGKSTAKPNVYRECDKLAELGFLTKEAAGYQAVKDMIVNVREAA